MNPFWGPPPGLSHPFSGGGDNMFRYVMETNQSESIEQAQRRERIDAVLPAIRTGQIYHIQRQFLELVFKDLKAEGNDIFKMKNFAVAQDYYSYALQVGRVLQVHHFQDVDRDFLSTLFSNRAACCLKLDDFKTAAEDCSLALDCNRANIKAYFRKALALKSLHNFKEALATAEEGKKKALAEHKDREADDLESLIREIAIYLPPTDQPLTRMPTVSGPSRTVAPPKSTAASRPASSAATTAPPRTAAPSKASAAARVSAPSGLPDTSKPPPPRSTSAWASANASINSSSLSNKKQPNVDTSWLKGTSADPTKANRPKPSSPQVKKISKKAKKKKKKSKGSGVGIHPVINTTNKYDLLNAYGQDSESEETDDSEQSVDSGQASSFSRSTTSSITPTPLLMPGSPVRNRPSQSSTAQPLPGMGLDSFGFQVNDKQRAPSKQPSKPPLPGHLQTPTENYQKKGLVDFIPLRPRKRLAYPFSNRYDFTLACDQCYRKVGYGPNGYQCLPGMRHSCPRDVLLVKEKDTVSSWVKIRPRPEQVYVTGVYRLCNYFCSGQPCRYPEMQCSYAHNEEEVNLWTLDREGQLNLQAFVAEHRNFAQQCYSETGNSNEVNFDQQPYTSQPLPFSETWGDRMSYTQVDQHYGTPQPDNQYNSSANATSYSAHPPLLNQEPHPRMSANTTFESSARAPVLPHQSQNFMTNQRAASPSRPVPEKKNSPQTFNQPQFLMATPEANKPGPTQQVEFPLKHSHNFKLVCKNCLQQTPHLGRYQIVQGPHSCSEDILVLQKFGDTCWVQVRERGVHRRFSGKYALCWHYTAFPPRECSVKVDSCHFAHNYEEQHLWTLEKDSRFNIQEFILKHRTKDSTLGFSIDDLFRKHQGRFLYLCKPCFYGNRICGQNGLWCGLKLHIWMESRVLVYFDDKIDVIEERPFKHKNAFFRPCHNMQFCARKQTSKCYFAHSMVEKDVWLLERDQDINRDDLLKGPSNVVTQAPQTSNEPLHQGKPATTAATAVRPTSSAAAAPPQPLQPAKPAPAQDGCPHKVVEVCGLCWKNGNRSSQDGNKDRCTLKGSSHLWNLNKICLLLSKLKTIRPLPKKIPSNCNFIVCRHVREKKKCDYSLGGYCQFAHSPEEISVWTWMVKNNIKTLEELVRVSKEKYKPPPGTPKPIGKGQSVVTTKFRQVQLPKPSVLSSPLDVAANMFYCHYCAVQCNSQKQWEEHCSSEKHMFHVNSDKEHQWNFRQPPWGVVGGNYELCQRHQSGKCKYSNVPDVHNMCKGAHSQGEFDEWKERYEWRQMKRKIAKKEGVYSYMDELVEEYENTESTMHVMTEEMDKVDVKCSSDLSLYKQDKNATHIWVFDIETIDLKLEKVALLYNKDRLHFSLLDEDLTYSCQFESGENMIKSNTMGMLHYQVEVKFTGGIYGSFMQWVVFDFGKRPLLVRKLTVELGTQFVQEKVKRLRQQLKFDRWTSDNREIVKLESSGTVDKVHEIVLKRYKVPSSAESIITQQSVGVELNRHNYVHKMHKLLQIEEITREQIIASYNLTVEIELFSHIIEVSGMLFPRTGELFAKVPLNEQLTEDTDAGKLILSSVQTVLIAPENSSDREVYEADIVQKENFDYEGRARDHIYLCLARRFIEDMQLQAGDCMQVEIQFRMNRLYFCLMHYAVDQLENNNVVFPDVSRINPAWHESHPLLLTSRILNDDQLRIVKHTVTERTGYSPPLIIYGSFGTGKTEALAQATMILVQERPNAKILICTQSNSAADLYITKHLDSFRGRHPSLKLLRIYFSKRRTNTVNTVVKHYCLINSDLGCFMMPTRDQVVQQQVVITTLMTSLHLTSLGLHGHFTHIFIDEAGQALECEAVMPLTLATEKTCVVLAGDHMQMSPRVYSPEAKKQRFHRSLLERLFRYYESYHRAEGSQSPLNVLLRINYRSRMEIIRFLSAVYYGGPDRLICKSNLEEVEGIVPLTFYTAQGHEVQDLESTSYYNNSEIEEVTERVDELFNKWPEQWGERNAEQIAVITPYFDQVLRVRSSLRQKRKELRSVTVERVQNVQGKEFRAVFISTVRTMNLAENPPKSIFNTSECDGEVGDFGFLSDTKLLNTAFTRAQSLVAVVGDPVALCTIGECISIWRAFLKHCQNMESIFPKTVTLQSVKAQVISLANSPLGENLSKLAVLTKEPSAGADSTDETFLDIAAARKLGPLAGAPTTSAKENITGYNGDDKGQTNDNIEYPVECDDVIKQLAVQALQDPSVNKSGQKGGNETQPASANEPLKIECVRVRDESGHAVVYYNSVPAEQKVKQRRLLTADDYARDFESDADDSDDESTAIYMDYTEYQLRDMMKSQPSRYLRCRMYIESSQRMFAKVLDAKSLVREIKISSRVRCGRAFHSDEVVVEILPIDDEDKQAQPEVETVIPLGQVVGILKRSINPKHRTFVCVVEQGNTGLMVPLNRGIPKMYNVETNNQVQKAKKGHVCVYTFTRDREILFHHYEPVDPFNTMSKLFLVRFLKWDAKFYSPLGIVVGVIPAGTTIEKGLEVLAIEHDIPKKFKPNTLKEVEQLLGSTTLFQSPYPRRLDYRDKLTFTIDPPDSADLDDALSIEVVGSSYEIGVHIADVSYFVKPGSSVDSDAYQRGVTNYPVGQDPIHMLPAEFSTNLCSLIPNKDRLTLSLFITINAQAEIVKVQPRRCVIRSRYKLDYDKVESIIKITGGSDLDNDLQVAILRLSKMAHFWRKRRLGNASLYYPLDAEAASTPEAHLMVEEIMVTTNHQVALLLSEKFPESVPLRRQLPPDEIELDRWRQKFASVASNTVALTQPFLYKGTVCHCEGTCLCVTKRMKDLPTDDDVHVRRDIWEKLRNAVLDTDVDLFQKLLVGPEYHPQTSVALLRLRSLQERSDYVCSGDISEDDQLHYSLNIAAYTHFTSPIRRYIDIVVHRLLIARLEKRPSPYTKEDIATICAYCTDMSVKANRYEQATESLHLAARLQKNSLAFFPVVENIDNRQIQLRFPSMKSIVPSRGRLNLSLLNPTEKPVYNEELEMLNLGWEQRIYDLLAHHNDDYPKCFSGELDPTRYTLPIPGDLWQQLLSAILESDSEKILEVFLEADDCEESAETRDHYDDDVTSEGRNFKLTGYYCKYNMTMKPASVVKVQVSSELFKGMLSPRLQLLSLAPRIALCLQHQAQPVQCFAKLTTLQASKKTYKDEAAYLRAWQPVLAIEAANSAVTNDGGALIHNVRIRWQKHEMHSGPIYTGVFQMPLSFCRNRFIQFSSDIMGSDEEDLATATDASTLDATNYDYLCVRYADLPQQAETNNLDDVIFDLDTEHPVTWIGHCLLHKANVDKSLGCVTVQIRLHQNSVDVPEILVTQQDDQLQAASIQWIPKPLPDRRMETALQKLEHASDLAKDIALGTNPAPLDESYVKTLKELSRQPLPNLSPLNQKQDQAIQRALSTPFTLIQGPPGTGKTVTGVRLALLFALCNRSPGDQPRQVLYCGPSNKSVDVVASYLIQQKENCPKLVRVYSEQIVHQEFPLPDKKILPRQRASYNAMDPAMRDIALHHLIRRSTSDIARRIHQGDKQVQESLEDMSPKDVHLYMRALFAMEEQVLSEAEIILCTCTASSSSRILTATNIHQLIIDECGMCKEPESMVPIITSSPKQVVLIGDHKQLRPIVVEETAKRLGLEKSLFERYSDKAIMLTAQYRMHEAIASFPSEHFYSGSLECGKDEQTKPSILKFWPNGRNKPIAFVHLLGCEEAQAVATAEGGEMSKCNKQEAALAVKTATLLERRYHIKPKDIVVLSQYRLQCEDIKKALTEKGDTEISVSTVIASQGSEWDYVILSTVRSLPKSEIEKRPTNGWKKRNLGFITDEHQINVAITRARKGLIIIGNKHLLRCDPMWQELLEYYNSQRKVVDAADFMTFK